MILTDIEGWLASLGQLRQNETSVQVPSVHKPLLLLLALQRASQGKRRLASASDFAVDFEQLLDHYETSTGRRAYLPLWHLQSDDVGWEVVDLHGDLDRDPSVSLTKQRRQVEFYGDNAVVAGFEEDLFSTISDHPDLVERAGAVLARYFPNDDPILSRIDAGDAGGVKQTARRGVNAWWLHEPAERYWMEITDRPDLGGDLQAPQLAASGKMTPSYELVRWVEAGDIVFHWWKPPQEEPALVGYSRAVGDVMRDSTVWQARGTSGKQRGSQTAPQPGWRFSLSDFEPLPEPITQARVRDLEPTLREIRDRTQRRADGAVYYPFALSDKRPIRAAQGYLFKMPREVVSSISELAHVLDPAVDSPGQGTEGGDRRHNDHATRHAIERHSVGVAMEYLESVGAVDLQDVGTTKSWDIDGSLHGRDLRVEVKGSTSAAVTVELTNNEVINAQLHEPTRLIVVDQIVLDRVGGNVKASGGQLRVWEDWTPEDDSLTPTRWRYTLPGHDN